MPFETTHWSLVYAAGGSDSSEARQALEQLCTKYWRPLYHFAQRRGLSPEEAEDMTQEFFMHLLEKHALNKLDHKKGRFRTFLLTSFTNMLNNEWDKQRAQKRSPGKPLLPLSVFRESSPLNSALAADSDPELAFDRDWAMTVVRDALEALRVRYDDEGKLELLQVLTPYLTAGRETRPYTELSNQLGVTTNAVKVAVHRARKRYREEIRRQIAQTVRSQEELDEELKHLLNVLSSSGSDER